MPWICDFRPQWRQQPNSTLVQTRNPGTLDVVPSPPAALASGLKVLNEPPAGEGRFPALHAAHPSVASSLGQLSVTAEHPRLFKSLSHGPSSSSQTYLATEMCLDRVSPIGPRCKIK